MIARHDFRQGGSDFGPASLLPSKGKSKRRKSFLCSPLTVVLTCFLSSVISFYAGVFVGMHMEAPGIENSSRHRSLDQSSREMPTKAKPESLSTPAANDQENSKRNNSSSNNNSNNNAQQATLRNNHESTVHQRKLDYLQERRPQDQFFLPALEYVDRDDFLQTFESLGVPFDATQHKTNDRAMILYSHKSSYPDPKSILESDSPYFRTDKKLADPKHPHRKQGVILSVQEATQNCHSLHVILTEHEQPHQCLAILGQYESFHVHKFMRASPEPDGPSKMRFPVDPKLPLRPVNRGMNTKGGRSIAIPTQNDLQVNWRSLATYLPALETVLEELRPIAKKVSQQHNKTVVVMVCNFGQSELLMNFVCNARARGLGDELSSILLFSTDRETHELATSVLGLTSFYNEEIFGAMPKEAAEEYGDNVFRKLMFAKVYCVHLVSMLGHDLLFQDVDVVWYKNPLDFFLNNTGDDQANKDTNKNYPPTSLQNYDMVFQDDGNRGPYYAPYSANTGFYYVKNNPQTRAFFNSMLLSGDMILSTYSHQIALIALLSEHASLYGLKVKVWDRNTVEFPGGHFFHYRRNDMKKIAKGELTPYIFHMSWTNDKSDKVKYMQQMGQWYLKDSCRNKSKNDLETSGKECCSIEPLLQCHYRDKPSIIPCPDAPFIDQGGVSFW